MKIKYSLRKLLLGVLIAGAGIGVIGKYIRENNYPKVLFDGNINGEKVILIDYIDGKSLHIKTPITSSWQDKTYEDFNKDGLIDKYIEIQTTNGYQYFARDEITPEDQSDYNSYLNKIAKKN
jgi:hypothetical protein